MFFIYIKYIKKYNKKNLKKYIKIKNIDIKIIYIYMKNINK